MAGFADNLSMRVGANVRRVEFFTSTLVKKIEDANRKNLGHAGGLIRKIAKDSMKSVRDPKQDGKSLATGQADFQGPASAPPGTPPLSHTSHPWLKRHLYYAYDPISRSVVVGPALLGGNKATGAPEIMEFSGQVRIRNKRRKQRYWFDVGEIDLHSPAGHPRKNHRGEIVMVRYAKLRTPKQVARANRLNEQLYGPMFKRVRVAARPFMRPALDTAEDRLVDIWKDTIVGTSIL